MSHIILTLIITFAMTADQKPTLISMGDPICSWSYGIAPELGNVKSHFGNKIYY